MTPHLSLVIPLYNEAGNILPLVEVCVDVLKSREGDFEIILANDGSTDATAEEIAAACSRWPQCRDLPLPHGGQAAALLAGLHAARGELLLTLDGDGQNDPRDFPELLDLVERGDLDVACGWRADRHDSLLRQAMSRLGNAVRRRFLADGVQDAGCQLRVMRREVRTALFPIELMQSFLPAIAVAAGFRVGERQVRHHPRRHGDSKYGFLRLWLKPALAMLRLRGELRRRFPR
ncbi:glycosyltransferase family 2 protein [Oleiharenicola lentus]|uniref:Glycosyltransferase family 2 protein n=1 Tax=Oleiharenicola lentus TaxID=2508720 RepID=A0A4Q1CAP6_9BACT|nr:glycosyltransferase family 2 protein [Oleiharenicola lentus]RXK56018.1 glycosyltransferase family 2 protein [Oleiharenicola lentus]